MNRVKLKEISSVPDVISNTSCLIALDNIGRLSLLKDIYGKILITQEVAEEFGHALPGDWILVVEVANNEYCRILSSFVDRGEASTIALALERPGSLTILDDGKARKLADRLDVNYTGLLGVILKAKKMVIVDSVGAILQELTSAGFRMGKNVEQEVLRLAGEK